MADDLTDYHKSDRGRRHSWYGTKPVVKRVLSWQLPHFVLRHAAELTSGRITRERLPAPARMTAVQARMAGVSFVMRRPDRCIVAKELYWGKGVRPRPADQLALDVFAKLARGTRLVLDVGAYTGIFSLLAARVAEDAEVHAFEVVPEVAKAALDNVVANDLLGQVSIHIEGIGEDGDTARIEIGSGGSALPDFYSTQLYFENGVHVPVRSLDSLFQTLPERLRGAPTIMKVDVEGTENVVLRNGHDLLATNQPDIVCEVLPGVADVAGIEAALAPYGYRYYRFEQHVLTEHAGLVPREPFRDWLFTTKTRTELSTAGVPV